MNTRQTIEFITLNTIAEHYDVTVAFQLRTDRSLPWLQKICIFVLRKLGAFYRGQTLTVERHPIDAKSFMERIVRQRAELEVLFYRQPTQLLIGAEDYAELMDELVAATRLFSFKADYNVANQVFGLTVKVVPWMRGVLVML